MGLGSVGRRGLVLAALVVISIVVLGSGASGAWARGGAGGALVVKVSGLAKGVKPVVRVMGPGGFLRALSRSGERFSGLAAGRYVLEVERATGHGMVFSAGKHDRVVTHVSAGVTRVAVAYVFGERTGAVGVAHGGVLSAKLSRKGGGSVVLIQAAAKGVHPGGYVVIGASKHTPEGFLGRVTSVKPKVGKRNGVRVVAAPATLGDVLPELDVSLRIPAKRSTPPLRPSRPQQARHRRHRWGPGLGRAGRLLRVRVR